MKLMSFEEWKKENPDIQPDNDMCPVCNGTGEVECQCSECGDLHNTDCNECDGMGDLTPGQKPSEAVLRALYEMQLEDDKRRLQRNGIEYEEAE